MKNDKEFDPVTKEAFQTYNGGEGEFFLSEWFGAIFYYLLKLGKVPFDDLYQKKFRTRNVWTGWLLRMALLVVGLLVVARIMMVVY